MGFSFAVFYTFFGIPLGRLADSRSRRTIIAAGFAAWSVFTAACGLARNFTQMLLLRMGVGVGEAALSPAAYSLITDYFPKKRLATAISVYSMGIYIGSGLALILGAAVAKIASAQEIWNLPLVGATRPWQVIFFIVGLPGVLLALLLYTVREPSRRGRPAGASQIPFREVVKYLWSNRTTFLCHNVGFALISFSNYGASAWVPTFFVRNHGWSAADAGYVYGASIAIFGTLRDRRRRKTCRCDDTARISGCSNASRAPGNAGLAPDEYLCVGAQWKMGGDIIDTGAFFDQRSLWCRACCHPTNDAQRDAWPGICDLSLCRQSDRARPRSHRRGYDY